MDNRSRRDKSALTLQSLFNCIVGFLNVDTLKVMNDISEFSISINGNWCFSWLNKTILNARLVIVLTKAWGTVHNTSTSI